MASSSSSASPPHHCTSPCHAEATMSGMQLTVRLARTSVLDEQGNGDWLMPRVGQRAGFTMFQTTKETAQLFLDKLVTNHMAEMTSATAGNVVDHPTACRGEAGGGGAASGMVSAAASGDSEVTTATAEAKEAGDTSGGWLETKQVSPLAAAGSRNRVEGDGSVGGGGAGDGGRRLNRSADDTSGHASMTATTLTNAGTATQGGGSGGGDGDLMAAVASPAGAGTVIRSGDSGTVPMAASCDSNVAAATAEGKEPGDKSGGCLEVKQSSPQAAAGSLQSKEVSGPAGGGHMGDGGRRMRSDGTLTATASMNVGVAAQDERGSAGDSDGKVALPMRAVGAAPVASTARAGTIGRSGNAGGNTSGGGGSGMSLLPVGVGKSSTAADSAAGTRVTSTVTRSRSKATALRKTERSVPTSQVVDDTAAALSAQAGAASPRGDPAGGSGGKGGAASSLFSAGTDKVAPSADTGTSSRSNGTKMATRGRKAEKPEAREGSKKQKTAEAAKPPAASSPPEQWEVRGKKGTQKSHLADDSGLVAVSSEAERLTCKEIRAHIASLDTGIHPSQETIKHEGEAVLASLSKFISELDSTADRTIRNQGAALTKRVKSKLSKTEDGYHELQDFAQDVEAVYTYFIEELKKTKSEHSAAATGAEAQHQAAWLQALKRMADIEDKRAGDLCNLCRYGKRSLEPPAVFCDGADCKLPQARIPRKKPLYYYPGFNWHNCNECFERAGEEINILGKVVGKTTLLKKNNDEIPEETMVECGACGLWMHETCALYNPYPSGEDTFLECPKCILRKRERTAGALAPAPPLRAQDLPHGEVSRAMEEAVQESLLKAYQATAKQERTSLDEVVKVAQLHIREVSVVDTTHVVDEGIRQYVGSEGTYPRDFPVRERCLVITQGRDGSDVFLFVMYTFEYGHTSPSPNTRRVLISFLDSINLMEPRKYRSLIYKEALMGYLTNVKERGFHTAHIWSSAPTKGDNYIFNIHPSDQRTSSDARLYKWYESLLNEAQERGTVLQHTNLFDEYWPAGSGGNPSNLCTLPYLKGDYWIEKALMLIKEPRKKPSERPVMVPAAQVSISSSTTAASREAARRRATLGETTKEDGPKRKGAPKQRDTDKKSKMSTEESCVTGDPVMAKLGEAIAPIKRTFIVAHLRPRSFAREMQARREREISIEAARAAVQMADATGQKPDVKDTIMAAKSILPDETRDAKIERQGTVFDDRESFLNLCIKNCFQFNTWRHAKYASAMLLHFMQHPDHMPGKEAEAK